MFAYSGRGGAQGEVHPSKPLECLQICFVNRVFSRLEAVRKYDYLLVRNLWKVVFSPWFGVGGWILALHPWCGVFYEWSFLNISKQLVFSNPNHEAAGQVWFCIEGGDEVFLKVRDLLRVI